MMTLDPDVMTLVAIVLSLTVLMWLRPSSRTVLVGSQTTASVKKAAPRRLAAPTRAVRLSAKIVPVEAATPVPVQDIETPVQEQTRSAGGHMLRVNEIINGSIDTARSAQCLHRHAQEQVDSAHYALQNLLNELSAVMLIAAPVAPLSDVTKLNSRRQLRPVYETALAA